MWGPDGLGANNFGEEIKVYGVYFCKDGIPAKRAMLSLDFCYDTVLQSGV